MRTSRLSPYGWFSLFLVLALVLAGCAGIFGGGSAGTGATRALMAGSVPSTITSSRSRELNFTGMTVRTSVATTAVRSDGTVGTMIYNGGPQFAEALDSEGRTVFAAYVSNSTPNFNVNSTALAVGYLALAGPGLKADGRLKLLAEMSTLSGFSALEDAIGDQHDAQGYLDLEAPAINAALTTLASTAYDRGRGVLATPTSASGLSLNTITDSKLGIQNTYLRRVELWFRRTSYRDAQDVLNETPTDWTKVEMPLVGRYGGVTGTLDGFLKGEVAYSPVDLDPKLDMPRFPATAKQTKYELYAMGPGLHITQDYVNAPNEVKNRHGDVELKALFLDAFLVFFSNVAVPLGGDQVDDYLKFVGANAAITDIIGTLKSTIPDLGDLINQGKYAEALKKMFNAAYTSNTILPALTQMTLDFIDQNANLSDATYDQLFNGFKGLLDKMGKIDIGFTIADLVILFNDIRVSNKIDRFELVVTPGKLTLSAAAYTIRPTGTTTITATIQDKDPDGTYEYHWSVVPGADYWVEDSGLNGSDDAPNGVLITSDATVNIRGLRTTAGSALVKCEGFRLDGGRRAAGDDDLTITFDPNSLNYIERNHAWQILSKINTGVSNGRTYYLSYVALYFDVPKVSAAFKYVLFHDYIDLGRGNTRTLDEPIGSHIVGVNPASYPNTVFGLDANPPPNTIRYYNHIRTVVGGRTTLEAAQADVQNMINQANVEVLNFRARSQTFLP